MKNKLKRFKWLIFNTATIIINIFIKRDKRIWLFGAWMGNKFADNSRFLFQYIHENLEQSHIHEVVWVTRNKAVYDELSHMGYKVFMCGTKESLYYHFKAGVHLICNMYDDIAEHPGDIDGRFSWGATKIQLWHGVGIKACGGLRKNIIKPRRNKPFAWITKTGFLTPGGWNKSYWLVTSAENGRVALCDHGAVTHQKLIYSSYPRFNNAIKLLDSEKTILNQILQRKKSGYRVVIYLPTFREDYRKFVQPNKIDGFVEYLLENKILWIEKKHFASNLQDNIDGTNILVLKQEFDVNILFDYCDLIITDYSSVITDAIAKNIRTLNYVPDYDYYTEEDRGFVADFSLYNPGILVKQHSDLISEINKTLSENYFDLETSEKYLKTKEFLIGEKIDNYSTILDKIWKIVS